MVERANEAGSRLSFQEQHQKLHSRAGLLRTLLPPRSTRCAFFARNSILCQELFYCSCSHCQNVCQFCAKYSTL